MVSSIKLFEPGKIGNLEIKNRIVMPAMGTHWATDEGYVTQAHIDYYAERAKGGVGLVTTECCCVQFPIGRSFLQISVDNDKYLSGLSKLAEAIKKNGARAALQLQHAGGNSSPSMTGGMTPAGPSELALRGQAPARSLSIAEIKEIVRCFVDGAIRARKAGFDAVEVHGAHRYLLAQFASPVWNERKDEYGGSLQNRARIYVEIIRAIRDRLPDYPLICRMNAREWGTEDYFGRPGLVLEEGIQIARLVEGAGADALHISRFGYGRHAYNYAPVEPAELLPLAAAVKKVVSVPVIGVGRLLPEFAESALKEGKVDFIAIGRGLITDPYLPEKVRSGRLDDIAPCITCYECLWEGRLSTCSVNARNGEEGSYLYPIPKSGKAKKVIIIGGGPGGMEAARVAALRGHKVTLYEKEQELGGRLPLVDKTSSKKNMRLLSVYLKKQVEKAGVKVLLGVPATPEIVMREQPDAVIIATGSKTVKPQIKGLDNAKIVDALDYLAAKVNLGPRVIIIGGEMVGCEVAEVLADRGWKDITIVRRGPELAMQFVGIPKFRYKLLANLEDKGVKARTGVTYKEVNERGLVIIDKEGKEQCLEADTIILATGAQPDNRLALELNGKVPEVFVIGDAREPRRIIHAIHEGFKTAYAL